VAPRRLVPVGRSLFRSNPVQSSAWVRFVAAVPRSAARRNACAHSQTQILHARCPASARLLGGVSGLPRQKSRIGGVRGVCLRPDAAAMPVPGCHLDPTCRVARMGRKSGFSHRLRGLRGSRAWIKCRRSGIVRRHRRVLAGTGPSDGALFADEFRAAPEPAIPSVGVGGLPRRRPDTLGSLAVGLIPAPARRPG
jgi:hypothetical protein